MLFYRIPFKPFSRPAYNVEIVILFFLWQMFVKIRIEQCEVQLDNLMIFPFHFDHIPYGLKSFGYQKNLSHSLFVFD